MHVLKVIYLLESSTLKLVKIAKQVECITCSVLQESIIGTLLFLVYVIDLANASRLLDPILFSDDSNLYQRLIYCKEAIFKWGKNKIFIHPWPLCLSKLIFNNYEMRKIYQVPWRFIRPILNFRAQK